MLKTEESNAYANILHAVVLRAKGAACFHAKPWRLLSHGTSLASHLISWTTRAGALLEEVSTFDLWKHNPLTASTTSQIAIDNSRIYHHESTIRSLRFTVLSSVLLHNPMSRQLPSRRLSARCSGVSCRNRRTTVTDAQCTILKSPYLRPTKLCYKASFEAKGAYWSHHKFAA